MARRFAAQALRRALWQNHQKSFENEQSSGALQGATQRTSKLEQPRSHQCAHRRFAQGAPEQRKAGAESCRAGTARPHLAVAILPRCPSPATALSQQAQRAGAAAAMEERAGAGKVAASGRHLRSAALVASAGEAACSAFAWGLSRASGPHSAGPSAQPPPSPGPASALCPLLGAAITTAPGALLASRCPLSISSIGEAQGDQSPECSPPHNPPLAH